MKFTAESLFSDELMDFLATEAPAFEETRFIKGALKDIDAVSMELTNAVDAGTRSDGSNFNIRVMSGDSSLLYPETQRMSAEPIYKGERVEEWMQRNNKVNSTCISLNKITRWNEPINSLAAEIIKLVDVENSIEYIDVYSFIADCPWSPFAIHRDYEVSMILHLGPDTKTVWVWNVDREMGSEIRKIPVMGQVSYEIEKYLPYAEKYTLEPGDFISIPKNNFHLFRNDGVATFIGIALYEGSVTNDKKSMSSYKVPKLETSVGTQYSGNVFYRKKFEKSLIFDQKNNVVYSRGHVIKFHKPHDFSTFEKLVCDGANGADLILSLPQTLNDDNKIKFLQVLLDTGSVVQQNIA